MNRLVMGLFLMLAIVLVSCGEADLEGIVIESTDQSLLIAQDLTVEEYENMSHKSPTDIQNDDVSGEGPHLGLMKISYDQAQDFAKGDVVKIWLTGDIMESYPSQAEAKKIKFAD